MPADSGALYIADHPFNEKTVISRQQRGRLELSNVGMNKQEIGHGTFDQNSVVCSRTSMLSAKDARKGSVLHPRRKGLPDAPV